MNEEDVSEVIELDEAHVNPKKTSFVETKKTKIQLTWKNITIKAPAKKARWQKADESKDVTILGKLSSKYLILKLLLYIINNRNKYLSLNCHIFSLQIVMTYI